MLRTQTTLDLPSPRQAIFEAFQRSEKWKHLSAGTTKKREMGGVGGGWGGESSERQREGESPGGGGGVWGNRNHNQTAGSLQVSERRRVYPCQQVRGGGGGVRRKKSWRGERERAERDQRERESRERRRGAQKALSSQPHGTLNRVSHPSKVAGAARAPSGSLTRICVRCSRRPPAGRHGQREIWCRKPRVIPWSFNKKLIQTRSYGASLSPPLLLSIKPQWPGGGGIRRGAGRGRDTSALSYPVPQCPGPAGGKWDTCGRPGYVHPRRGRAAGPGTAGKHGWWLLCRVDVDPLESTHFVRLDRPVKATKGRRQTLSPRLLTLLAVITARRGEAGSVMQRPVVDVCLCRRGGWEGRTVGRTDCLFVCLSLGQAGPAGIVG